MAIISSSNVNYKQAKLVFRWLRKNDFYKKHKNKDENEGIKKYHRNKVNKSSVEDIINFCTRNDNAQDVVCGAFDCAIDDNRSFVVPSWIRSINRE